MWVMGKFWMCPIRHIKVRFICKIDSVDNLISEQQYIQLPSAYQVQKYGQGTPKQLVLTFDDGPDDRWTPKILNTLSKYHVPAAFLFSGFSQKKPTHTEARI